MKLETKVIKTLKIMLDEPAKNWFSNFTWGDDEYEEENFPDTMTQDKWEHFITFLKVYLVEWQEEDIDFWDDDFSEYSLITFEEQIQELIDVDIEGFDMVMI